MNIICADCGEPSPRTGNVQRYCKPCSAKRDLARKTAHSNKRGKDYNKQAHSRIAERGREISRAAICIPDFEQPIVLGWSVRASIEFDWAASKNHVFSARQEGHATLRLERKAYRAAITAAVAQAMGPRKPLQNKLWIDVLVQKPSHRGDAANVIDTVCDAIKTAIGLDDRWFCIRRVDWQIVKTEPKLIIQIGQETGVSDVHACSSCGRVLEPGHFHANKGTKSGLSRNCRDCSAARRRRP